MRSGLRRAGRGGRRVVSSPDERGYEAGRHRQRHHDGRDLENPRVSSVGIAQNILSMGSVRLRVANERPSSSDSNGPSQGRLRYDSAFESESREEGDRSWN